MGGYVYIMCSLNNSTLYVGVTSNLPSRVYQHKTNVFPKSFTSKYNCKKLVYYNWFETIIEAIAEEKRIKGGSRKKKEILINNMNPEWNDLYEQVKFF
jgi:putative endonuclease